MLAHALRRAAPAPGRGADRARQQGRASAWSRSSASRARASRARPSSIDGRFLDHFQYSLLARRPAARRSGLALECATRCSPTWDSSARTTRTAAARRPRARPVRRRRRHGRPRRGRGREPRRGRRARSPPCARAAAPDRARDEAASSCCRPCTTPTPRCCARPTERGTHGMGTTLSAVMMRKRAAVIANVGDSRVYSDLAQGPRRSSPPTTRWSMRWSRAACSRAEQARTHPDKHVLTRRSARRACSSRSCCTRPGARRSGRLLLCSDGLHDSAVRRTRSTTLAKTRPRRGRARPGRARERARRPRQRDRVARRAVGAARARLTMETEGSEDVAGSGSPNWGLPTTRATLAVRARLFRGRRETSGLAEQLLPGVASARVCGQLDHRSRAAVATGARRLAWQSLARLGVAARAFAQ